MGGVLVLHFSTFRNKIHLNENYEIHLNENYEIWKICHIFGNFYIIKKNDDGQNLSCPVLVRKTKKRPSPTVPVPERSPLVDTCVTVTSHILNRMENFIVIVFIDIKGRIQSV